MPAIIPITSLADPRVAPYANVREKQLASASIGSHEPGSDFADDQATPLFLAEGELVVRLLIGSRFRTHSVLLTPTRLEALKADLDLLPGSTPVYVAEPGLLSSIVGFNIHRGVLAAGVRPVPPTLDDLLARGLLDRGCVVAEGLTNHDNVGSIFRSLACLAGTRVPLLMSPECCDPLYRKSIRVSMGHALRVPFATLAPWADGLRRLKAGGMTLVALTPDASARSIDAVAAGELSRPALLLGAEGPGLSALAFEHADLRVRIPQAEGADSLNVGVAAAIALHRLFTPQEWNLTKTKPISTNSECREASNRRNG